MREIKFRVWDKKEHRFFYVVFHPTQISWGSPKYTEQHLLNEVDGDISAVSFENIEGWQQFTGLYDKNGKEIYEGDIVELGTLETEDESEKRYRANVRFSKGQFWCTYYGFPIHSWACNDNCFIEVIGNIYKNPELIETR